MHVCLCDLVNFSDLFQFSMFLPARSPMTLHLHCDATSMRDTWSCSRIAMLAQQSYQIFEITLRNQKIQKKIGSPWPTVIKALD